MITFYDSERFEYEAEDSHQGVHTVLRELLPGCSHCKNGNCYLTVQDDTYYVWKTAKGNMEISSWVQAIHAAALEDYLAEEAKLPQIELGYDGFKAQGDFAHINLGEWIDIIPRACYPLGEHAEKWIVDLAIPAGRETCVFYVYGEQRVSWMNLFARLDEPLLIRLKEFELC